MAKYGITYSCGHSGTESLFGKGADRERKIKWLEECAVCPDCFAAQKALEKEKEEERRKEGGLHLSIGTRESDYALFVIAHGNTEPFEEKLVALGFKKERVTPQYGNRNVIDPCVHWAVKFMSPTMVNDCSEFAKRMRDELNPSEVFALYVEYKSYVFDAQKAQIKKHEDKCKSAEIMKTLVLLPMKGTEKQIAWAETIRIQILEKLISRGCDASILDVLRRTTSSRWWIDHRGDDDQSLKIVVQYASEFLAEEQKKKTSNAEDKKPVKKWHRVSVDVQNIVYINKDSARISMPDQSDFSFWCSMKLLKEGRNSSEIILSMMISYEFSLKKYGKDELGENVIREEKIMTASDMIKAFGGEVEDLPSVLYQWCPREESVRHIPRKIEPVEIEADENLKRQSGRSHIEA